MIAMITTTVILLLLPHRHRINIQLVGGIMHQQHRRTQQVQCDHDGIINIATSNVDGHDVNLINIKVNETMTVKVNGLDRRNNQSDIVYQSNSLGRSRFCFQAQTLFAHRPPGLLLRELCVEVSVFPWRSKQTKLRDTEVQKFFVC